MGYTRVIQVANLSPSVTREHMRNLFYPIGRISDMKLFPERDNPVIPVATKILFIKFDSSETVGVALHLNNTVFLDRMIDVRAYEPGRSDLTIQRYEQFLSYEISRKDTRRNNSITSC